MEKPFYQRILLKLSGEALLGSQSFGIDPASLQHIRTDIAAVMRSRVQVALVIGGGNIFRGAAISPEVDRVTADQMGMLATVMNGLALRDAFLQADLPVQVFSAIAIPGLVEIYDAVKAKNALAQSQLVIFVGGTGNPLVTTDSAAALRGIEIRADILLKATKVDGVFASDPLKNPQAKCFSSLRYDEVLEKSLGIMDLNAILLCKNHHLPLRVFNMNSPGALQRIVQGEEMGTLIKD